MTERDVATGRELTCPACGFTTGDGPFKQKVLLAHMREEHPNA